MTTDGLNKYGHNPDRITPMVDPTLLLNADGTPVSLVPISTQSWEEAVSQVWANRVEVLHWYDHWTVRSPTVELRVPAVCILRQHVTVKRRFSTEFGPSPDMVFLRDGYRCQYCRDVFPRSLLTLDHVIPRTFGGTSRWDNLSSACSPCNGSRGHDTRIQPMTKPFRPSYGLLVRRMKEQPIIVPHPAWNWYLGWPEERVTVMTPPREKLGLVEPDNFDFGLVSQLI